MGHPLPRRPTGRHTHIIALMALIDVQMIFLGGVFMTNYTGYDAIKLLPLNLVEYFLSGRQTKIDG